MENETNLEQYLVQCQRDLTKAESADDPRALSLAQANFGYALCLKKKYEQGMDYFNQAEKTAGLEVDDLDVIAHGLGLRILAYQQSKRLPDAFQTANKILLMAEQEDHPGVECDALTSQGQVLLASGELEESFRRLQEAENIAENIQDEQRLLKIKGELAALSLAIPSLEKAEAYYRQAVELAETLEDTEAEMGYLGNVGAVMAWQGKDRQAVEIFQEVLSYERSEGNPGRVIPLLKKLVESYDKLQEDQQVLTYGIQGLEFLEDQSSELIYDFLEPIILAYYRQGKIQEAHNMTSEAVTIARSTNDPEREAEFLMSLGESFLAADMLERALDTYQSALQVARKLDRDYYQAQLMGRIALVNAELGNLEEARDQHQQAIEMAQEYRLRELEGDQRSLLAMTYHELDDMEKAREQAERALDIFQKIERDGKIAKAQQLVDNYNKE